MRTTKLALFLVAAVGLSGCLDSDAERGVAGAAAGAVLADATGNNALTGAIIGAGAGVYCDDAGICR